MNVPRERHRQSRPSLTLPVTNLATQFADRVGTGPRTTLVSSGIPPIDEHLHGLMPGRTYVLSGAPGTGKSVACLQFLAAALNAGERAAIVTQDDPEDLLAQSEFLGFDLANAIAQEQLYLIRFQLDFARRFGRAPSPEPAFAELRHLLGSDAPSRIVIDSVVPFIDGGSSAATSALAMLQLLDELGSTSLVTYPGDLAGAYDRRLDPLVQRAAAILHLTADRMRHRQIEIRKVRYRVPSVSPIPYRIEPGAGLVVTTEELRWQQEDSASSSDRQRLVIDVPNTAAPDALRLLQSHYNVKVVNGANSRRMTPPTPFSLVPTRRAVDISESGEPPELPAQPMRDGERVAFDAAGFNAAILEIVAEDPRAVFTVAVITPPPGLLGPLAGVALRTVRAVNGDLVAMTEDQVMIYLHGTGRKHAPYFIERLRENWKNVGAGEIVVDTLGYPADQDRIRTQLNTGR
jgi:KaiC/GvpD/RAD55 family RecA-like ATPase